MQFLLAFYNSRLNVDLFRNHGVDDPNCSCGAMLENNVHYFLECPLYARARDELMTIVRDIVSPNVHVNLFRDLDRLYLVNLLLRGSADLSTMDNIAIAHATQSFIIKTGRFQ